MTEEEKLAYGAWYRALGRCIAARGLHPCQLVAQWHVIEELAEKRRREGASATTVANELWPT